ncbi:MAG: hypothetical protein QXW97_01525 [Candidatus Pacearchaeota archaeon]
MKILSLGNEFIKEDSLGKKLAEKLIKQGYDIINIRDSFELIEELNSEEDFIIIDVVKNLDFPRIIKISELNNSNILTCHDFDASFIIKLFENEKKIKIIGIPMNFDVNDSLEYVKRFF